VLRILHRIWESRVQTRLNRCSYSETEAIKGNFMRLAPCSPLQGHRRFGGPYYLHHHNRRLNFCICFRDSVYVIGSICRSWRSWSTGCWVQYFGPKRKYVTGSRCKLLNVEPRMLYASPNIIRMIISGTNIWARNVARTGVRCWCLLLASLTLRRWRWRKYTPKDNSLNRWRIFTLQLLQISSEQIQEKQIAKEAHIL
jgi:hypothetical protein